MTCEFRQKKLIKFFFGNMNKIRIYILLLSLGKTFIEQIYLITEASLFVTEQVLPDLELGHH